MGGRENLRARVRERDRVTERDSETETRTDKHRRDRIRDTGKQRYLWRGRVIETNLDSMTERQRDRGKVTDTKIE